MNKQMLLKITALLLIVAVFAGLAVSCGENTAKGLIESVAPKDASGNLIPVSSSFEIKTTSSTDRQAVARALSVSPAADFTVDGSGRSYTLSFKSTLHTDTVYKFSSHLHGRTVYEWAFQTVADFAVVKTVLPTKEGDRSISFEFSYADVENFEENFSIFPAVKGSFAHKKSTWTFTADSPLPSETRFTVTLKKGVKNAAGISLAEDITEVFTTPEPSGDFIAAVREGSDYAGTYLADEKPQFMVKYRGIKDLSVKATVYRFGDFKQYLAAHKTYFEAPDFTDIAALTDSLETVSTFETSVIEYTPQTETAPAVGIIAYPSAQSAGYYLSVMTVGGRRVYHVFQVSGLCVAAVESGNSLNVWVNSVATGKPLTDTEVILDSEYDEKTNENGIAVFDLTEDKAIGRYMVVNDPQNPDTPYVSYIAMNADRGGIDAAWRFNCALYTDKNRYSPRDEIKLFGIAAALRGEAAEGCVIRYHSRQMSVSPDKNGAFEATIPLDGSLTGSLSIGLYIGDRLCAETSVTITDEKATAAEKPIGGLFVHAKKSGDMLLVSADNITSENTGALLLNSEASERYGRLIYTIGAAEADYTVEVIRRTLFTRERAGEYYDYTDGKTRPRYRYKTVNQEKTVRTAYGKLTDGAASVRANYKNDPQNGIYYVFKVRCQTADGKTAVYELTNRGDTVDSGFLDDSLYTLSFEQTTNIGYNSALGAVLSRGAQEVKSGSVLLFPAHLDALSGTVCSAGNIALQTNSSFYPETTVLAAYFDGKRMHILNRSALSLDAGDIRPTVTATADRSSYAEGDTVALSIHTDNAAGKGVSLPVLVGIYEDGAAGYPSTRAYSAFGSAISADFITEQASSYTFAGNYTAPAAEKRGDFQKFSKLSAAPIYFGYVTTDSSGKAELRFTAPSAKKYTCCFTAFTKTAAADFAMSVSCTDKPLLSISAKKEFSQGENSVIHIRSNITAVIGADGDTAAGEPAAQTSTTAKDSAPNTESPSAADDSAKTAAAQYSVSAELYRTAANPVFDQSHRLQSKTVSAAANEDAVVDFGKLPAGDYTYRIRYSYGDRTQTVDGTFTVAAGADTVVPSIVSLRDQAFTPPDSAKTVTAMLYGEEYQLLFELAQSAYTSAPKTLAGAAAKDAAARLFGKEGGSIAAYLKSGTSQTEDGEANPLTVALAAAVAADSFEKTSTTAYFTELLSSDEAQNQSAALLGLSALGGPVLDRLHELLDEYTKADNPPALEKRLMLALSLASIGDFDGARKLSCSFSKEINLKKPQEITIGSWDNAQSVAMLSLLCSKLSAIYSSDADRLMRYLREQAANHALAPLCTAQYIACFISAARGSISVKSVIGGNQQDISFEKNEFRVISINADDIKSCEFSKSRAYICALYPAS